MEMKGDFAFILNPYNDVWIQRESFFNVAFCDLRKSPYKSFYTKLCKSLSMCIFPLFCPGNTYRQGSILREDS